MDYSIYKKNQTGTGFNMNDSLNHIKRTSRKIHIISIYMKCKNYEY